MQQHDNRLQMNLICKPDFFCQQEFLLMQKYKIRFLSNTCAWVFTLWYYTTHTRTHARTHQTLTYSYFHTASCDVVDGFEQFNNKLHQHVAWIWFILSPCAEMIVIVCPLVGSLRENGRSNMSSVKSLWVEVSNCIYSVALQWLQKDPFKPPHLLRRSWCKRRPLLPDFL